MRACDAGVTVATVTSAASLAFIGGRRVHTTGRECDEDDERRGTMERGRKTSAADLEAPVVSLLLRNENNKENNVKGSPLSLTQVQRRVVGASTRNPTSSPETIQHNDGIVLVTTAFH